MVEKELRGAGVRHVKLALEPDTGFDEIVDILRESLTFKVPKGGCAPCLSGLDRLSIDSVVFERLQQVARFERF